MCSCAQPCLALLGRCKKACTSLPRPINRRNMMIEAPAQGVSASPRAPPLVKWNACRTIMLSPHHVAVLFCSVSLGAANIFNPYRPEREYVNIAAIALPCPAAASVRTPSAPVAARRAANQLCISLESGATLTLRVATAGTRWTCASRMSAPWRRCSSSFRPSPARTSCAPSPAQHQHQHLLLDQRDGDRL